MSDPVIPPFELDTVNLTSPKLGTAVIFATDEFFGSKERLINDAEPIFIPDKYDNHGKWMDGWESRRRRDGGYDYCIISLKSGGTIVGVDIDTRHFTGNHPPHASLDGTYSATTPNDQTVWTEIIKKTEVKPDSHNLIKVNSEIQFNYLRFNIFPDGGVARLRVYGRPTSAWNRDNSSRTHELSAISNGGYVVAYNDAHYGNPWVILTSGRGVDMGDGWETRRRRQPGNDWIIIALGARGIVKSLEVDTAHFKGNYPDYCSVESTAIESKENNLVLSKNVKWTQLMDKQKLSMDHIHRFDKDKINLVGPVTHLRLSIYPDGGISRFRAFGHVEVLDLV